MEILVEAWSRSMSTTHCCVHQWLLSKTSIRSRQSVFAKHQPRTTPSTRALAFLLTGPSPELLLLVVLPYLEECFETYSKLQLRESEPTKPCPLSLNYCYQLEAASQLPATEGRGGEGTTEQWLWAVRGLSWMTREISINYGKWRGALNDGLDFMIMMA